MDIISKIVEDSEYLKDLVENEYVEIGKLFDMLPVDLNLIVRMYNWNFNFVEYELIKLIKDLSYIDNCKLEDIIYYLKYKNYTNVRDTLNTDLLNIYDQLKLDASVEKTFIERGNFQIFIWVNLNSQPRIKESTDELFITACKHNQIKIATYLHNKILYNKVISQIKNSVSHIIDKIEIYNSIKLKNVVNNVLFELIDKIEDEGYQKMYNHGFQIGCKYNCVEIVKFIYSLSAKMNIKLDLSKILEISCWYGHLELSKFLYSIGAPFTENLFLGTCVYGYLDTAKFVYYTNINLNLGFDYKAYFEKCLIEACTEGHINIVKWLYELGVNISYENHFGFRTAAVYGQLEVAKWLYQFNPDIHYNNDDTIEYSCMYGNLKTVEWLYSIGGILKERYFINACIGGKTEIIQWLYCKCDILNIGFTILNKGFLIACKNGNFDTVSCLERIKYIRNDEWYEPQQYNVNKAFRYACKNGHFEIVAYLNKFKNININSQNGYCFIWACGKSHLEIVKYLLPLTQQKFINQGLIKASQKNNTTITKLIQSSFD